VGVWVWIGGWVGGCVYKIEKFRTLYAPSEIASLREAISSSAPLRLNQIIQTIQKGDFWGKNRRFFSFLGQF
jgi:hypothetical protein